MKHIFENLKKYWYFVILILALLVVQAYCDLSLPDYTSNIIDVGIVNGGVEHQMPEFITENSYNSLKLFLNEQETKDWDNAYEFSKSDKAYKLKNTDKDNLEELDSEFGNVIAVYYMMSSQQDSQFAREDVFAQPPPFCIFYAQKSAKKKTESTMYSRFSCCDARAPTPAFFFFSN